MTKTVRLNDLQLVLLSNAAARDNGSLVPLPNSCTHDIDRIGKAVTGLLRREFVEELPVIERDLCWREQDQDMIGMFITGAGRAAIGANDRETAGDKIRVGGADDDKQMSQVQPESTDNPDNTRATSPRATSKSGMIIALLQREHGATLEDMIAATGWLPHTTRAALTGLRRKGHDLISEKLDGVRRYRIAVVSTQAADAK